MSYQMALCARICRTGAIAEALQLGITRDDFTTETGAKSYWEILEGYYTHINEGANARKEIIERTYPELQHIPDFSDTHSLKALCVEVRRERVCREATNSLVQLHMDLQLPMCDPVPILAKANESITKLIALSATGAVDVDAKQGLDSLMGRITQAQKGIDLSIMRWPWDPFNRVTMGLQPDDYVVFYGRPKSMKSWILAYLIAWAWEQEVKVLVYTKEMTPDNVYARVWACVAKANYDHLRRAQSAAARKDMTAHDSQNVEMVEHQMKSILDMIHMFPDLRKNLVVLSGKDVKGGGDTVTWLRGKVEEHEPRILFIDGMYLLSTEQRTVKDDVRVMQISRGLRQLTLDTGVPTIATMQANRKAAGHSGANLDEIAYSDALGQDATMAMRVIADKNSPTVNLVMGGSREFKLHGIRVNGVPGSDFSFHSVLSEKDIEKAKEQDQSEAEQQEKVAKEQKSKQPKEAKEAKKHQKEMNKLTDTTLEKVIKTVAP